LFSDDQTILQWQNSGLPVAIAALQILNGKLNSGVQLPYKRSVFANIKELEEYGVVLKNNRCHTLVISQIEFF
jgi:hypothetical protein